MIDDIHEDADTRMKKTVESVKVDLTRIRTGRATTALLDHVLVDYYGSDVPLNQAATVSVLDARTLSVQAWEKSMVPKIEKAIMESDLGLNPVTAGEIIRIPIPALTEERRREMTKIARQEGENGKIAIRNIRRDAGNHIRELTKEKEIGEDDEKKGLDKIQLLTDKYSTQLDELVKDKEADLMEV